MPWAFWDHAEHAGILKNTVKNNVKNQNIEGIWYFKANQNLSVVEGCYAWVTQVKNFQSQKTEILYRKYQIK